MAVSKPTNRSRTATVIDGSSIQSKSNVSAPTARINASQVGDPAQLARHLQDSQSALYAVQQAIATNPHSGPCIVRNVSCANGATVIVRHTLGRALTDWWICRMSGSFLSNYPREILPTESGYPAGVDPTTALVVLVTTSGSPAILDFTIAGA